MNRFYNEAVGIIQIPAASYRISVYQIILLNSLKSQSYVVSLKTKKMINIDFTRVNNVSNKSLDNLFGGLVSSINSSSVYYYTDINAFL
ncbi:hypothetical protein, partial [Prevotella sp. 885]|uniref:hypothetical protein n=1 Tax=Prevotella sp. 885 TaxID=2022527 RepID=UPI001C3D9C57